MKSQDGKELTNRRAWLKPAAGLTVINPETGKPLPADGELVVMSKYWRRRLSDRDANETAPPSDKTVAPKKSKKEA